jgi:ribonuclease P protein component
MQRKGGENFMEISKKIPTLKQRHMFGKVYSKAVFRTSKGVVVYYLKNYDKKNTVLGISVSKKRGNAVVRNRTRRIIKEAYRKLYGKLKKGYIIVIVARQACTTYKSTAVEKELSYIFSNAGLFN